MPESRTNSFSRGGDGSELRKRESICRGRHTTPEWRGVGLQVNSIGISRISMDRHARNAVLIYCAELQISS